MTKHVIYFHVTKTGEKKTPNRLKAWNRVFVKRVLQSVIWQLLKLFSPLLFHVISYINKVAATEHNAIQYLDMSSIILILACLAKNLYFVVAYEKFQGLREITVLITSIYLL